MAELIKLENIDSNRRPWKWTPLQLQRAEMVGEVVDELKQYWPLTLRQIFYRLVGKDYIENTQGIYNQSSYTSEILTRPGGRCLKHLLRPSKPSCF